MSFQIRFNNFLSLIIFILLLFTANPCFAQWLDWSDETSELLLLSSVSETDSAEKVFKTGDLNQDGWEDVIVVRKEAFGNSGGTQQSTLLLLNQNGILTDETEMFAPEFLSLICHAKDLLISDFDGDGWLDVIIANTYGQQVYYFENQGLALNGHWMGFKNQSEVHLPLMNENPHQISACAMGDINGDDFLDVYFLNSENLIGAGKDYILMNDGNGNFSNESDARLGVLRNTAEGTSVRFQDIDNDGDLDILKTSLASNVMPWSDTGLFILFNDGTGHYTNWQKVGSALEVSDFVITDFNADGIDDVYILDSLSDQILTTGTIVIDQSIIYTAQTLDVERVNTYGHKVKLVDLDLDGNLNLAISDIDIESSSCTMGSGFSFLEKNMGSVIDPYDPGTFSWSENVFDYCFIDINNDGLKDLLLGLCNGYKVLISDNCTLAPAGPDYDGDGLPDACDACPIIPSPGCVNGLQIPRIEPHHPIMRKWNEMLLESIRKDLARPTVHARNLFHFAIACWDSYAAVNPDNCNYLLGNEVDGFSCSFDGFNAGSPEAIDTILSYAAYRLLSHRFDNSPNATILQFGYDFLMHELGLDKSITSMNYFNGNPAHLGNYIADCIINFGLQDGSNEQNDYANLFYETNNPSLIMDLPGNPDIEEMNSWQPLTLDVFIDQSGNVIPLNTPPFLSPEWGQVSNFAMVEAEMETFSRDGNEYEVYHDPGLPPQWAADGSDNTSDYVWGNTSVILWSSHLDPTNPVSWDISPGVTGNSAAYPTGFSKYFDFYHLFEGGSQTMGHAINPVTGEPYASNSVPRGDFARVLAEFWADGPDSETPPGHWFTILNYVADHHLFEKRYEGQGEILNEAEWYAKGYLAMGGAMHDAAVTAWGIKGWYDYIRPVSAIRALAELGQSTDPVKPNYHVAGLPLISDYIELIESGDPLIGDNDEHLNKIKVKSWLGSNSINSPANEFAGVGWIRAEDWVPYQRPSFVTPPFAGYVSGHSTFSRAAAEVMTAFTGNAFFPGGMGTFLAKQNEFLVFEDGPSVDVELQWATYRDAADQSGLSRIWGGIHPPADDIPGRILGIEIGLDAYEKVKTYFEDTDGNGIPHACDDCQFIRELSLTHSENEVYHWKASHRITTDSDIQNGANVKIDATNWVRMDAGFEVDTQSTFEALVEGCDEGN